MAKIRNIEVIEGTSGGPTDPGAGVPIGTVLPFAGDVAPLGFLICHGQALSRSEYDGLFAVINTIHGAGDGSTTFNIPDLRQRFPIGKADSGTGSTLGTSGGQIDHTHSLPAHNHAMAAGADLNITSSGGHATILDHTHSTATSDAGTSHTHGHTLATGAGTSHSHSLSGFSLDSATTGISIVNAGGHSHTINHDHTSPTTGGSGTLTTSSDSHNHTVSGTTSSDSHSHTATTSTHPGHEHFVGRASVLPWGLQSGGGYTGEPIVFSSGSNINTGSGGAHSHTLTTTSDSHSHTWSDTSSSDSHSHTISSHTHTVDIPSYSGSSSSVADHIHGITDTGHTHTASGSIGNESSHTHPITGSIGNESSHTHDVDVPAFSGVSGSLGNHFHTSGDFAGRIGLVTGGVSGDAGMTSGSQNPPFYVLNFIIKY